jgi:hypothetical protein
MNQLALLSIPRQPQRPEEAVIPTRVIKAYVKDCLKGMNARQAERERKRTAKRQPENESDHAHSIRHGTHGGRMNMNTDKPYERLDPASKSTDAPNKRRMYAYETHEKLLSYFWLAFKSIMMAGILAAFTADMLRFVMHSIDRIGK